VKLNQSDRDNRRTIIRMKKNGRTYNLLGLRLGFCSHDGSLEDSFGVQVLVRIGEVLGKL